ncbi:MAG: enoyl-CoA hydratase-related protein [Phycisphaerales bacterium]
MSHALKIDRDADGIATLWLEPNPQKPRGGVVVLDAWLIDAIAHACAQLAREGCSGLVLASASTRVFVAGADLAEIDALDDAALHAYLRRGADAFAAIPALGVPSVAVVHRAALGGGLELAMHCDALVGTLPGEGEKPWLVGLPECGLCICPGWGGTQMLPARIDAQTAIVATATGTAWKCAEVPAGLFASVLPAPATQEALLEQARRWIRAERAAGAAFPAQRAPRRTLGPGDRARVQPALDAARAALPASAHASAVIDCVAAGLAHGWEAAVALERERLVQLRHTEPARAKLTAFLSR